MQDYEYLLSSLDNVKGIGKKTIQLFYKKKIKTIFDLLWHLPTSKIETSRTTNIDDLQIGKEQSIILIPLKYNFPRIRNLPNRVNCLSSNKKIDCIFFNSYEGYIKKILPINKETIVYGKVGFYKGKYQITNPKLIKENEDGVIKDLKNYSLTEGLTLSKYNKIVEEVLKNIPNLKEWKVVFELIPQKFKDDKKLKRSGIAGFFSASLELSKEGLVSLMQKKSFDKLLIKEKK